MVQHADNNTLSNLSQITRNSHNGPKHTSKTFLSLITLAPSHVLQRSSSVSGGDGLVQHRQHMGKGGEGSEGGGKREEGREGKEGRGKREEGGGEMEVKETRNSDMHRKQNRAELPLMISPIPLHRSQRVLYCCTNPGPSR